MSFIDVYQLSIERLRAFSLRPISRLFMNHLASEPPHIPFVFEPPRNAYKIRHWADQVASMDPSVYAGCDITHIDHRKAYANKEHEFLVTTISHIASGHDCFLSIERCVESELSSSSDRVAIGSKIVVNPRPAADLVQFVAAPTGIGESKIVGSISFPSGGLRPSIANLSVLLSVISQHAPNYDPKDHNCYWYAHTISEVLRTEFNGQDTTAKPGDKADRAKYSSIHIPLKDSLLTVHSEYQAAWLAWTTRAETEQTEREMERARVMLPSLFQVPMHF